MKFDMRLKMVQYALEHGIKPTARAFGCQVRIVRKWVRRWKERGYARSALMDRSRAPKTCPRRTPPAVEARIVRERKKAPCLGAARLKEFCEIPAGVTAIARILRQHGLTRRRKKKYEKKRDLRAVKACYKPFEQLQVDVKHLNDIPYYGEQLMRHGGRLPLYQYTCRDVKTGGTFVGYGDQRSESHACCFVAAVASHLKRTGFPLRDAATIQTDNGSEFSGAERKPKEDRGFHHVVEALVGAQHRFIPVGKKNYQADVESFHERVETEFFDLERFAGRDDFFDRASAWILWWNAVRKNTYKYNRAPDHILLEDRPERDPKVWLLPALDVDRLVARRASGAPLKKKSGGYYVLALPGFSGAVGASNNAPTRTTFCSNWAGRIS